MHDAARLEQLRLRGGAISLQHPDGRQDNFNPATELLPAPAEASATSPQRPHAAAARATAAASAPPPAATASRAAISASAAAITLDAPITNLLITTKANHTLDAVARIRHRLTPASVVVLLQNGVLGVHDQLLRQLFPCAAQRPAFLLGSTTHGAYRRSAFDVVHAGSGSCVFGRPPTDDAANGAASEAGGEISAPAAATGGARACGAHGPATTLHAHALQLRQLQQARQLEVLQLLGTLEELAPAVDVTPAQLQQQLLLKLVVNCCINPLAALLHSRNGAQLHNPAAEEVWTGIIRECVAVLPLQPPTRAAALPSCGGSERRGGGGSGGGAAAHGASGGADAGASSQAAQGGSGDAGGSADGGGGGGGREAMAAALLEHVRAVTCTTARNYNSMLQDVVAGSLTEVDFLNGYVADLARRAQLVAPWNGMLVLLVKAREATPPQARTQETLL